MTNFSFDPLSNWLNEHSNTKTALLAYTVGGVACVVVYGVRKGVRGLRQYHIEKAEQPEKVKAETAMDRVLYETLKGGVQGIIPSVVWPAHLLAYGIVKWKEQEIVAGVDRREADAAGDGDEHLAFARGAVELPEAMSIVT